MRRFLSTLNRWWWSWLCFVAVAADMALLYAGRARLSVSFNVAGVILFGVIVSATSMPAIRAYGRLRASRRPKRHEPTQGCHPIHCYSCNLDEPGHGAYIVCGECGHVYPTPRSLRRAWRAAERRALQFNNEGYRSTWRSWLADRILISWLQVTIRASRIYSCALCSHDW